MSFRVFWFVVAGFVLGFVTSTLWEWLYYRQKRLQSLTTHNTTLLDAQRNYSAAPNKDPDNLSAEANFDAHAWTRPSYRSSGILLESEEHPLTPDLAGVPANRKGSVPSPNQPEEKSEEKPPARLGARVPEETAKADEHSLGNHEAIAKASALAAATLGTPKAATTTTPQADLQEETSPSKREQKPATSLPQPAAISPAEAAPAKAPAPAEKPSPTQPFVRRPTDYPDDLAMVKGIGEAYKRRLYASGLYTWMQLAASDTDALRRITRAKPNADIESWQTEARTLAEKYQRTEANFTGPLDDFTRIEGIGAITADILYKAGICVYEQLAALLPDELALIVPAPTVGNENDFDGWLNDASRLALAKRRNNGLLP